MTRIFGFVAAGLLAATAVSAPVTPARATPPQILEVQEVLFGVDAEHVYTLRHTSDNLGLHIPGLEHTFLVARDIETGRDAEIWPVYRVLRAIDYSGTEDRPTVDTLPMEGAVDPFALLAERGGWPVAWRPPFEGEEATLTAQALTVTGHSGEYVLPTAQLFEILRETAAGAAEAVQPYPDDGSIPFLSHAVHPSELVGNGEYKAENCSVEGHMSVYLELYGKPLQLVDISCDDPDWIEPVGAIVIVPPAE